MRIFRPYQLSLICYLLLILQNSVVFAQRNPAYKYYPANTKTGSIVYTFVTQDGLKEGACDADYKEIIPPIYRFVYYEVGTNAFRVIDSQNTQAVIDSNGNFVIPFNLGYKDISLQGDGRYYDARKNIDDEITVHYIYDKYGSLIFNRSTTKVMYSHLNNSDEEQFITWDSQNKYTGLEIYLDKNDLAYTIVNEAPLYLSTNYFTTTKSILNVDDDLIDFNTESSVNSNVDDEWLDDLYEWLDDPMVSLLLEDTNEVYNSNSKEGAETNNESLRQNSISFDFLVYAKAKTDKDGNLLQNTLQVVDPGKGYYFEIICKFNDNEISPISFYLNESKINYESFDIEKIETELLGECTTLLDGTIMFFDGGISIILGKYHVFFYEDGNIRIYPINNGSIANVEARMFREYDDEDRQRWYTNKYEKLKRYLMSRFNIIK